MTILDLYVNSFDASKDAWTKVGTSPYLDAQDQPTNYIYSSSKKAECGDFGFIDSGKTTEIINTVTLYIYGQEAQTNAGTTVSVWNGVDWTEYTPDLPLTWGWCSVDVGSILNTWGKIDGALIFIKKGNNTNRIDIDCAYLKVDYAVAAVWKQLQYATEPPTTGAFNKLKYVSEPPVPAAWNKLAYEGE